VLNRTLTVGGDDSSTTFSGVISGGDPLIKVGTGTLTLTGANTYGATFVRNGTLSIGDGGTSGTLGSGDIAIDQSGVLTVNRAGLVEISSNISGNGEFEQIGPGTTVLSGTNTFFFGGTTVSGGTLKLTGGDAISDSGTVFVEGPGTLLVAADERIAYLSGDGLVRLDAALTISNAGSDTTFSGVISGSGRLLKAGVGSLTLTGASTYTGGTTISSGALIVGGANVLGTGAVALSGGVLQAGGTFSLSNAVNINANSSGSVTVNGADTFTLSGVIAGNNATLLKGGTGTLVLTGASTYSGSTLINAGTLSIGNGGTSGSLATSDITISAGAALIFNRSDAVTVATRIMGNGAITHTGTGTTTLTGANTYTGGTTIAAGAITATDQSPLGSGAVTVSNGASLNLKDLQLPNNLPMQLTLNGQGLGNAGALRNLSGNNRISPAALIRPISTNRKPNSSNDVHEKIGLKSVDASIQFSASAAAIVTMPPTGAGLVVGV
jgi:autotransporter-associated beta strand protein